MKLSLPYHSVYNAAGCRCTTATDLDELNQSMADAILTKSCTLDPRVGNPNPKYYDNGTNSINCNGLENMGYASYLQWYKNNRPNKPFILSVAGLSVEDNITIIRAAQEASVDAIELNLSCPNLQGTPISYDLDEFNTVLNEIIFYADIKVPFGLKLPVYNNPTELKRVAKMIDLRSDYISFITCSNSLPNGIVYDSTRQPIVSRVLGGCGGGPLMKSIILGQVYQFRQCLPNIDIIACGGMTTIDDIKDAWTAGANHCQVGTSLMVQGTEIFDKLKYD